MFPDSHASDASNTPATQRSHGKIPASEGDENDDGISSRPRHPEVLPTDVASRVGAVKEPLLTATLVGNRTLRVQFSGKPRVGTTLMFLELLAAKANSAAADIALAEVTTITTEETASSTYLFTHKAQDTIARQALQEFADRLLAELRAQSVRLPVPTSGTEFQMTVTIDRDAPDQLLDILSHFERIARGHEKRSANLKALNGQQQPTSVPGQRGAELQFIISFPEELIDPENRTAQDELAEDIRQIGRDRGENWQVTLRPFTGQFIDTMTGQYSTAPRYTEAERARADQEDSTTSQHD